MRISRGFSLIEVLIAATIMFSVLVSAALAFKTASLHSQKADQIIAIHTPLPLLQAHIRQLLEQQQLTGRGRMLDVSFTWTALAKTSVAPQAGFDADTGQFVSYKPRFSLLEVELKINDGQSERQFNYLELVWLVLEKH